MHAMLEPACVLSFLCCQLLSALKQHALLQFFRLGLSQKLKTEHDIIPSKHTNGIEMSVISAYVLFH